MSSIPDTMSGLQAIKSRRKWVTASFNFGDFEKGFWLTQILRGRGPLTRRADGTG